MESLSERDSKVIWHPYTQMLENPYSIGIVKGEGAYLYDENGKRYIDAVASWWVNLHGHSHPYIAEKISKQLQELEHCMFAGFTHEPAITLAENLLGILPPTIHRIFYSDNGSTAVEVALKMAIQYWKNKGISGRKKIIAIENAYHGDTFAAMSVSGRSMFTDAFSELLFDVEFIPFPTPENALESIKNLEEKLAQNDVAAFIAEPLIQGASGMLMYEPHVLESYFSLCKKYETLIIADEVFTGFGRTGKLFATDHVSTKPDIMCLSKGLTGGTLPMGVTACSEKIYDAFLSHDHEKTLYHGHSYTANPLACVAANASFDLLMKPECLSSIEKISTAQKNFTDKIRSHKHVEDARCCGTVLAISAKTKEGTSYTNESRKKIYDHFLHKGILMRPLGNIMYIVPPYCISEEDLEYIHGCIIEALDELF